MSKLTLTLWTLVIPCVVFVCGTAMPTAAHVYFRLPDQTWKDLLSWQTNALPSVMHGIVYFLTAFLIRTVHLKSVESTPQAIRLVHGRCLGAIVMTSSLGLLVNAFVWTSWYAHAGIVFVFFPFLGIAAMMAGLILGGMITRFQIEPFRKR